MNKIIDAELYDHVSEHYKKFFAKFAEIETLDVAQWRAVHLIAYICKKYIEHYGVKYSFTFSNPAPSKSYEAYTIKKLANMLTSNPSDLKNYIDWVFSKKIIEKKKRITSLAFFSHQEIVNEFKFKFLIPQDKKGGISRTDPLPQSVRDICNSQYIDIFTYGDLAFLTKMENQENLFEALRKSGFDINILNKVI